MNGTMNGCPPSSSPRGRCANRFERCASSRGGVACVPFAAAISVALVAVSGRVAGAVVSVAVGLAFDALAKGLRARLPWRAVIDNRLWSFEKPNVLTQVAILVAEEHAPAVRHALRRAQFSPSPYSVRVGTPPDNAADLTVRLAVQEPEAWPQSSSDEDRIARIVAVLRDDGSIRARVGGVDVLPARSDAPKGEARALAEGASI